MINTIRKLLGNIFDSDSRQVSIYKTRKHYKIATMYKRSSGSYIISKPVYILPVEVSDEEFTEVLYKSVNSSRTLSESEEDSFWLGKDLLKVLKEPSFVGLYRKSSSCHVFFGEKTVRISPSKKYDYKTKGLEEDESRVLEFKEEKSHLEITKAVREILTSDR